jgi:hypothetical protein
MTTNIAVAWANIAGNATVATSSAATAMPASLLQQEDISRHWRSAAGTSATIDLTFATTQSADTFDILGTNGTAAMTVRIELSNTALGNHEIWDSGTLSTNLIDSLFLTSLRLRGEDALVLASAVKSGWKYCRITLTDASLSYIEAGYLFIGTRSVFTYNPEWGMAWQVVDPSEKKTTRGGQTKVIVKQSYRQLDLTLGFLTETQRASIALPLDLANGSRTPVLVITAPDSTTLGRDSVFGFLNETAPMPVQSVFGPDAAPMYTRQFRIIERL